MGLQALGIKYNTDKAYHHHYLDFYEAHLPKPDFKGRLLEIGIRDGASLRLWREYYPQAEIVGIDIDTYDFTIEGVTMLQINSSDIEALKTLGQFDVIVDDGGHMTMDQQISFYWLYYHQLNKDGLYVLEDLHTSLIPSYINSQFTTLEMLERLKLEVTHYKRSETETDSMTSIIKAGQGI